MNRHTAVFSYHFCPEHGVKLPAAGDATPGNKA
nr:MAG TPA: hypothetical protein [Caudoviricetes sp.]